jgi:hypothetical protein
MRERERLRAGVDAGQVIEKPGEFDQPAGAGLVAPLEDESVTVGKGFACGR